MAKRTLKPLSKDSPERDFVGRFITAPGFGECTQLCDVVILDTYCEQIPDAFHVLRNGHQPEFPASIRVNLYEPLFRYLEELERYWWRAGGKSYWGALLGLILKPMQRTSIVRPSDVGRAKW